MGTISKAERSSLTIKGRIKAWAHGGKQAFVTQPDACKTCHRPHPHGENDELLIGEAKQLCLTCHSRALKAPDGRAIPPVMPAVAG